MIYITLIGVFSILSRGLSRQPPRSLQEHTAQVVASFCTTWIGRQVSHLLALGHPCANRLAHLSQRFNLRRDHVLPSANARRLAEHRHVSVTLVPRRSQARRVLRTGAMCTSRRRVHRSGCCESDYVAVSAVVETRNLGRDAALDLLVTRHSDHTSRAC